MSNQSNTFEDIIVAIVADFETVGWSKTTDNTRPAYFECLGARFNLSARAIAGIWDGWMLRRRLGKGMFDPIAG